MHATKRTLNNLFKWKTLKCCILFISKWMENETKKKIVEQFHCNQMEIEKFVHKCETSGKVYSFSFFFFARCEKWKTKRKWTSNYCLNWKKKKKMVDKKSRLPICPFAIWKIIEKLFESNSGFRSLCRRES